MIDPVYEQAYKILEPYRTVASVAVGDVVTIEFAADVVSNLLMSLDTYVATINEYQVSLMNAESKELEASEAYGKLFSRYEKLLTSVGFGNVPEEWLEELL